MRPAAKISHSHDQRASRDSSSQQNYSHSAHSTCSPQGDLHSSRLTPRKRSFRTYRLLRALSDVPHRTCSFYNGFLYFACFWRKYLAPRMLSHIYSALVCSFQTPPTPRAPSGAFCTPRVLFSDTKHTQRALLEIIDTPRPFRRHLALSVPSQEYVTPRVLVFRQLPHFAYLSTQYLSSEPSQPYSPSATTLWSER